MKEISDILSADLVSEIINKVKDAVEELKELDTILNQIKVSANLSDSDLATLAEQSFTIASQYGKSAKDYLLIVKSLSEAGEKNAVQMAELSFAQQSASSAAESVDTWENSLNRLNNTWTATIGNIADSDTVTAAINTFNDLLSIVNKLTDNIGPFASMSLIGGGILGANNLG